MLLTNLTPITAREKCMAFAANYPTPNVELAIAHAKAGEISWEGLARLFTQSLAAGIDAVSA